MFIHRPPSVTTPAGVHPDGAGLADQMNSLVCMLIMCNLQQATGRPGPLSLLLQRGGNSSTSWYKRLLCSRSPLTPPLVASSMPSIQHP